MKVVTSVRQGMSNNNFAEEVKDSMIAKSYGSSEKVRQY
ncbi:hypothetical protein WDC_1414 [Paucilactobacillus wasatchensis]|uniref:Uncharacterized protein n=1 Tax=Paucilactobacillus wasatchensis TaxID=1335616 RepID=A0A0D1A539_9LACO|nr:hypothetical protein WDC_1414 [Paucilactobacillus wasatchensis]